jgi:predicted tellurium resistance membrane protein TerC
MDIIFSLDSVITAIGMADQIQVMILAIIIAILFMMVSVGTINDFIDHNPTFKILALSFLVLVGVALLGEGLGMHIPKGYIYFAMAYAVGIEMINMKIRGRKAKVL